MHLYFVFQVHYDVGGIFFQQGCTDQSAYQKARDHFRQTKELLKKVFLPFTADTKLQFTSNKICWAQSYLLYVFFLAGLDRSRSPGWETSGRLLERLQSFDWTVWLRLSDHRLQSHQQSDPGAQLPGQSRRRSHSRAQVLFCKNTRQ